MLVNNVDRIEVIKFLKKMGNPKAIDYIKAMEKNKHRLDEFILFIKRKLHEAQKDITILTMERDGAINERDEAIKCMEELLETIKNIS